MTPKIRLRPRRPPQPLWLLPGPPRNLVLAVGLFGSQGKLSVVSKVLESQVWKMLVARRYRQGQAGAEGRKDTQGGEDTRLS